jgi:hypothetical protein
MGGIEESVLLPFRSRARNHACLPHRKHKRNNLGYTCIPMENEETLRIDKI